MNCCSWEWLKYSTVLLFPHDFTRVDHQEENSIILTLRDKIPHDSATLEVVWYLLLSWNYAVWLEGIPRVLVAWRHSGDALLLLLGAVWRSKFFLEFLSRSFRLSRVSSEIWLCWFNVQTRPDVKARSSFGVAPSFKKRAISSIGQRERARAGSQYFRPGDFGPSHSMLFQWNSSCRRSSTYTSHFPCSKSSRVVALISWGKYLNTFCMRCNHTLL